MNTYVAERSYSNNVVDCCGRTGERELNLNPFLPGYPQIHLQITDETLNAVITAADGTRSIRKITASACTCLTYSRTLLHHELTFSANSGAPLHLEFSAVQADEVMEALQPFLAGWADIEGLSLSDMQIFEAQRSDRKTGRGLFYWRKALEDPLDPRSALGICRSALYLAETGGKGQAGVKRYQKKTTIIPRASLDDLELRDMSAGVAEVQLTLPRRGTVGFIVSTDAFNALLEWHANTTLSQRDSRSIVKSLRRAADELLRLTGVSLPEAEAEEALREIHNFKWLEAERAGFDTWAVIQPTSPLRAAAVHWVRKYYQEFASARPAQSGLPKSS